MNGSALFAFINMPMIVVTMEYVVDRLHETSIKRYTQNNHSDVRS